MKKLVITTEKGGVGKTTLSVQLAFYLALKLNRRVLVLDLDVQNNASHNLIKHGAAAKADCTTYDLLVGKGVSLPAARFVLVPEGHRRTLELESRGTEAHGEYADNLASFFETVEETFDVCIMDTAPRADICHNATLITADYFLAPLVMSQYALDGVMDILYSTPWGYETIQARLNRRLQLIGILPVMVEAKPVQQRVFQFIENHEAFTGLLLRLDDGSVAKVPRMQAIDEAQNVSAFVPDLGKTSARDAWRQLKPVFDAILREMNLETAHE
jgi:chromosome partitioning protein